MRALVAEAFAAPLNALEVMASWVPVPAVMVSCWVPDVRPARRRRDGRSTSLGVAVVGGHRGGVGRQMLTLVMFVPPEVAANSWVPAELEVQVDRGGAGLVLALP